MRLGLRLLLGFFFLVGLATYFVLNVFVEEVKPGVRQVMEATLVDEANVLAELAAEDLQRGELPGGALARTLAAAGKRTFDATVWQHRKTRVDLRVTVTDARGLVLYDSAGLEVGRDHSRWNDVQRTLRGQYGARSSPEPGARRHTVMHVAAPILAPAQGAAPRKIIGVLTVSQPNRVVDPYIASGQEQIVRRGRWLIGASALVAVAMTWWLVTGIGRLRRYSLAVAAGQPVPPPAPRSDELGDLGRAMEQMRRKLEGKAYVEEYVQALTHELKSPLAAIRGAAELVAEPLPEADRRRFAEQIQAQERRLTETIDKLLTLAEVEQRGWLESLEPLAPGALLAEVAAGAEAKAKAAEVELEQALGDLPALRGDGYLLRQALGNLVDNALAFSPAGSRIELAAERRDDTVRLEVRDHGPGIPDYARARVFERFYSLPRPSTGARSSGLGLPFAREVARLHGGTLELVEREGGGTTARLTLPLAARAGQR